MNLALDFNAFANAALISSFVALGVSLLIARRPKSRDK